MGCKPSKVEDEKANDPVQEIVEEENELEKENDRLKIHVDILMKTINEQNSRIQAQKACIEKAQKAQKDQQRLVQEMFETLRPAFPEPSCPTMTTLQTTRNLYEESYRVLMQQMQRIQADSIPLREEQ